MRRRVLGRAGELGWCVLRQFSCSIVRREEFHLMRASWYFTHRLDTELPFDFMDYMLLSMARPATSPLLTAFPVVYLFPISECVSGGDRRVGGVLLYMPLYTISACLSPPPCMRPGTSLFMDCCCSACGGPPLPCNVFQQVQSGIGVSIYARRAAVRYNMVCCP